MTLGKRRKNPVRGPYLLVASGYWSDGPAWGIALLVLFLSGYTFGRASGRSRWGMGLLMVVLGLLLVGLTIALGG